MVDIKLIHKILLEKYEKCENYVEFKITKKNCKIVKKKNQNQCLIHNDLGDFNNTMNKADKRSCIIFIDYYSIYIEVYLLRNKDKNQRSFHKI